MKRISILLSTLALAVLAVAPAWSAIVTEQLLFRTTRANITTSALPWTLPSNHSYFADSSTFQSAASALNNDTTMAYPIAKFAKSWISEPAIFVADSVGVPWLLLTVTQDDQAYAWSGATTLDSIYVAAEVSLDGNAWTIVDGDPTKFYIPAATSPIDGAEALVGIEQNAGADFSSVLLSCEPGVTSMADRLIINRNLCVQPGFVRFIISKGAGTGQFKLLATWQE